MSDTILACIITGGINLIGIYVANSRTRYKIISMLKTQDAVQDERIKTLTASVNRHNNFAELIDDNRRVVKCERYDKRST